MGMHRQSKHVNRIFVGLGLAVMGLLLAACSVSTARPGIAVPTSTFEPGPNASYRGLVIEGTLVRDGLCVRLIADEDSMIPGTLDVLWPRGSTADVDSSGEVEVLTQDGEVLGVTGTRVQVTGGAGSSGSGSDCLSRDRSQIEVETIKAVS